MMRIVSTACAKSPRIKPARTSPSASAPKIVRAVLVLNAPKTTMRRKACISAASRHRPAPGRNAALHALASPNASKSTRNSMLARQLRPTTKPRQKFAPFNETDGGCAIASGRFKTMGISSSYARLLTQSLLASPSSPPASPLPVAMAEEAGMTAAIQDQAAPIDPAPEATAVFTATTALSTPECRAAADITADSTPRIRTTAHAARIHSTAKTPVPKGSPATTTVGSNAANQLKTNTNAAIHAQALAKAAARVRDT